MGIDWANFHEGFLSLSESFDIFKWNSAYSISGIACRFSFEYYSLGEAREGEKYALQEYRHISRALQSNLAFRQRYVGNTGIFCINIAFHKIWRQINRRGPLTRAKSRWSKERTKLVWQIFYHCVRSVTILTVFRNSEIFPQLFA